ncbi:MAG: AzlD domain-containing protein [Clostridia bacterium]
MIYLYIFVIALVTYLIRMLPLTLFQKKIENKFIKSFLFYIPYACLTAMTIPSIFYATANPISGICGLIVAIVSSIYSKNLVIVALLACLAVFISEQLLAFFI